MNSLSQYDRTGNNAIDLVAEAVGHAKYFGRHIKRIILKPSQYALFWAGMEILRKQPFEDNAQLLFEGVPIERGTDRQFDSIYIEYAVA